MTFIQVLGFANLKFRDARRIYWRECLLIYPLDLIGGRNDGKKIDDKAEASINRGDGERLVHK